MKQPPPPYYQVALATEQTVSIPNENQTVQLQAVTHVATPTIDENTNVEHGIPPAYEEASQNQCHTTTTTTTTSATVIDGSATTSNESAHAASDRPQNQA